MIPASRKLPRKCNGFISTSVQTPLRGRAEANVRRGRTKSIVMIAGLGVQDSELFGEACRIRLESGEVLVDTGMVIAFGRDRGYTEDDLRGTIAELVQKRYIEQPGARGGKPPVAIRPTFTGLAAYVLSCERPRYDAVRAEVIEAILVDHVSDLIQLASVTSEKAPGFLEFVIDCLGSKGRLDVSSSYGGPKKWTARPNLRRE